MGSSRSHAPLRSISCSRLFSQSATSTVSWRLSPHTPGSPAGKTHTQRHQHRHHATQSARMHTQGTIGKRVNMQRAWRPERRRLRDFSCRATTRGHICMIRPARLLMPKRNWPSAVPVPCPTRRGGRWRSPMLHTTTLSVLMSGTTTSSHASITHTLYDMWQSNSLCDMPAECGATTSGPATRSHIHGGVK